MSLREYLGKCRDKFGCDNWGMSQSKTRVREKKPRKAQYVYTQENRSLTAQQEHTGEDKNSFKRKRLLHFKYQLGDILVSSRQKPKMMETSYNAQDTRNTPAEISKKNYMAPNVNSDMIIKLNQTQNTKSYNIKQKERWENPSCWRQCLPGPQFHLLVSARSSCLRFPEIL